MFHDAQSTERQMCGHILLVYEFKLFHFTQVGPQTNQGTLSSFTLILHGTKDRPAYLNDGPRRYNQDYNRVHKKVSGFKFFFFVGLSLAWVVAGGEEEGGECYCLPGQQSSSDNTAGNNTVALNKKNEFLTPRYFNKVLSKVKRNSVNNCYLFKVRNVCDGWPLWLLVSGLSLLPPPQKKEFYANGQSRCCITTLCHFVRSCFYTNSTVVVALRNHFSNTLYFID